MGNQFVLTLLFLMKRPNVIGYCNIATDKVGSDLVPLVESDSINIRQRQLRDDVGRGCHRAMLAC
ncbi:hypothetical protein [Sphingobium sp. HWE2-09]|uniref:hypothetical protein n=1 Tax=Sphingobium sp. HWE2-09 TaxID=3108390 RepID=UPI002DD15E4C|nr:hypothetical protein [Sphingobium sp. HWE2-09]